MNREILFRGKRIDNGEWVYGSLIIDHSFLLEKNIYTIRVISKHYNENHRINEKTVGQFTGLTDKNGNKIFEGDVLNTKTSLDDNWADRIFQDKTLVTAVFSEGAFRRDENNELLTRAIYCIVHKKVDYEITGNIHENDKT